MMRWIVGTSLKFRFIVVAFGPGWGFLINALTFLPLLMFLAFLRVKPLVARSTTPVAAAREAAAIPASHPAGRNASPAPFAEQNGEYTASARIERCMQSATMHSPATGGHRAERRQCRFISGERAIRQKRNSRCTHHRDQRRAIARNLDLSAC